jgi:hypothetical protein
MSNLVGMQGYGRYDLLRREFNRLQEEFEDGASGYPRLWHQWVEFTDPVSDEEWRAFHKANDRPDGGWQKWEVSPGGRWASRFWGAEDLLEWFVRLARKGMGLIARAGALPSTGGVILPRAFDVGHTEETGHWGWLELLYETAKWYNSPPLVAAVNCWGRTGQVLGEDFEPLAESPEGVWYPDHPLYSEFRFDLCTASVEALRVWLAEEPNEGAPVCLPPEARRQGPAEPNSFWLRGRRYQGFSTSCWRLLQCLWGRECVSEEDAMGHVYGEAEGKEGALTSAVKRLSGELLSKKCPAEVHRKSGYISLEVFEED